MKEFIRVISTCSIVALGVVAAPLVARAEPIQSEEQSGEVTSTTEALHIGARNLIAQALDDVELRPDQKEEVDKLRSEAETRHAPVKAAKHELMLAVADQIEKSSKIDQCELAPKIEALASAMAKAHPGDRAAFERLHSILDPDQRTKFVDALKRRWESHREMHKPDALVEKMAKELSLTDDQKASLRKIFTALHEIHEAEPAHAAHRERWSKILEAFKGDHFVLDEVAPMGDVAAHRTKRIEARLWAADAVLPVLTAEQRKVLAEKIRDKVHGHTATESGSSEGMAPTEDD